MLIKVTISAAMLLNLEPNGKPVDRCSAEMSYHGFGREADWKTHVPDSPAEINFFEMIEELFVKPAKLFQKGATKHHAAARLPIYSAFGLPVPMGIFLIGKRRPKLT